MIFFSALTSRMMIVKGKCKTVSACPYVSQYVASQGSYTIKGISFCRNILILYIYIYDIIMSCAVLDIHACRSGQTDNGVYYTREDEFARPACHLSCHKEKRKIVNRIVSAHKGRTGTSP